MHALIADAIYIHGGSGDGFVHQLINALLVGLCVAIVYAMGWFFFRKNPPFPPLVLYIWQGLFVLVGGLIVINFLLSLGGHAFINW